MGVFDSIGDFFGGLGGSLISGIGSFLGGERRNDAADEQADQAMQFSDEQARAQRAFSAQQAEQQMAFQGHWADVQEAFQREMINQAQGFSERMSNTAWQRGVNDMRMAGINPILAYSKGGSSSPTGQTGSIGMPSGAMGSSSAPQGVMAQMADSITPAIATARDVYRTRAEVQQLEAAVGQTNANTLLLTANAGRTAAEIENLRAHTAHTIEQIPNEEVRRRLMGAQTAREVAGTDNLEALTRQIEQQIRILNESGRAGWDPGSLISQFDAALRRLQDLARGGRGAAAPGVIPAPGRAGATGNPGARMVTPIPNY